MAFQDQLVLGQRQGRARSHPQLPLDQVLTGHCFRHRVLDLQPGVHLHEVEAQVAIIGGLCDEFDRAGAHITHGSRGFHGGRSHGGAAIRMQARRGGFFQHLLVSPLDRAVAFEQVNHVAKAVGKHLDLDVTGARHVAFDQHVIVAKGGAGLALAGLQRGVKVVQVIDAAHAPSAPAGAGLDEQRHADAFGLGAQDGRGVVPAVVARHQGNARALHQGLGFGLAAHGGDGRRRRADEHQTLVHAGLGETRVLAQEAVAGMDGFGAGAPGGLQDGLLPQVAGGGTVSADGHGFVAVLDMGRVTIDIGIHRDRADAEASGRVGDAAGDLAAVGNQDLAKHGPTLLVVRRGAPAPVVHPACATCRART